MSSKRLAFGEINRLRSRISEAEGYFAVIDTALLASIAQQMMNGKTVDVNGKLVPVSRRSKHRLRTLAFTMEGREYQAIEQNAEQPSRWGQWRERGIKLSSSRIRQLTDS